MKKSSWKLVLCLALAVVMLACTALAATAPDVAQASDATVTVGSDGKLTVTVSGLATDKQYALMQVKVDAGTAATAAALLASPPPYSVSEDSILYIDQAPDASGTVTFANFLPKSMSTSLFVLGGGDQPQVVGAMLTKGVTLTGTATAKSATSGDVTVTVKDSNGAEVGTATVTSGTAYSIDGIPEEAGLTVEVSSTIKGNTVTTANKYVIRTYALDATKTTTLNVELCPKGDVDNTGTVNMMDVTKLYNHAKPGGAKITDSYSVDCGKVLGGTSVSMRDVTALYNHARPGGAKLW